MANSLGSFICLDENTTNKSCMDISRVMVRIPSSFKLVETINVIDGMVFCLVCREDSYGPLRITINTHGEKLNQMDITSLEDSWSKHIRDMEGDGIRNTGNGLTDGYSTRDSS